MKINWPVDRGRRPRWLESSKLRISQPTTVVPKRRQETINRRCVKSPKQRNKYLWTHLPFNVRDKFSYEHACATVIQPKAGVLTFFCAMETSESLLTKIYLNKFNKLHTFIWGRYFTDSIVHKKPAWKTFPFFRITFNIFLEYLFLYISAEISNNSKELSNGLPVTSL